MTEARTYPAGVPSWVDLVAREPAAAQAFYGELLGWTFQQVAPDYAIASLDGADAGAIAAGDRPAWRTYIAVDDVAAVASRVYDARGSVLSGPDDVGEAGRLALCADPSGAAFSLWQARRRIGAQAVNVAGAWNFSDLHTGDRPGALRFYGDVFGWEADELPIGDGATATMWRRPGYGDHLEATVDPGIRERQANAPPGFADIVAWLAPLEPERTDPHWHVTFTVTDRDASLHTARRLGATVISQTETDWTRSAVIRDPHGAELTLSQFAPPDDF